MKEIVEQCCELDMDDQENLLLGMEGAHSEKRIVHGGGDATGKNLVDFLLSNLSENIIFNEDVFVYELLIDQENKRCIGAKGRAADGSIQCFYAKHVVIATGGCGQLYEFSSNAKTVTGDGIAMAYLAGAEITDMEFIQFHPTLLYVDGETRGLISEAVRGEGAVLVNDQGNPIMVGIHPYKDLAPRHIVSQTIYKYINKGSQVFLDITGIKDFESRFPSITALCHENGIPLEQGKIPVVPGSHFLMGGIKTDIIGRTSINGLYAIGEASCTGLHGANRLASNSLLEGLFQGKKLAHFINSQSKQVLRSSVPRRIFLQKESNVNLPKIEEIQWSMMSRVGIVRSRQLLEKQFRWIRKFEIEKRDNLDAYSTDDLTKIFMCITAGLITKAALKRTESRGGHFRSDYPLENDTNWYKKQIIYNPKGEEKSEQIKAAVAT
ncbi:MAG: FAD-binding protein [Bacillota bacterium]|nr:FAD-binding protein [Bacillota bacterium]